MVRISGCHVWKCGLDVTGRGVVTFRWKVVVAAPRHQNFCRKPIPVPAMIDPHGCVAAQEAEAGRGSPLVVLHITAHCNVPYDTVAPVVVG